jgi:hypothetical protein
MVAVLHDFDFSLELLNLLLRELLVVQHLDRHGEASAPPLVDRTVVAPRDLVISSVLELGCPDEGASGLLQMRRGEHKMQCATQIMEQCEFPSE